MSVRLTCGAIIEVLPTGSRVTLSTGQVIEGEPHDTPEYRETARLLGYGDDVLAMCRDHDPLHAIVCDMLGLGDSRALRVAAGLESESVISRIEEGAVVALQRLIRATGITIL